MNLLHISNLARLLAVFAVFEILSVPTFGQQPPQPNSESVAFHGGSGSQLLQQCEAALKIGAGNKMLKMADMEEALDGSFCRGFVLGILDTLITINASGVTSTSCIPNDVGSDQMIRITVKYLNDNPAMLHFPSGLVVFRAIAQAFPCKQE